MRGETTFLSRRGGLCFFNQGRRKLWVSFMALLLLRLGRAGRASFSKPESTVRQDPYTPCRSSKGVLERMT